MRREFSKKQRFEIIKRASNAKGLLTCEGCGFVLGPKRWELDHIIPEALIVDKTKPLTVADGQILGVDCCHRGGRNKTADDVRIIAKTVRQRDRHLGIPRSKSRPLDGTKASGWRKPFNGPPERRT